MRSRLDTRKFSFSQRVQGQLLEYSLLVIVVQATSVNIVQERVWQIGLLYRRNGRLS